MSRFISGLLLVALGLGLGGIGVTLALTLLAQSQGRITVNAVETATISPTAFSLNKNAGELVTQVFTITNTGNRSQLLLLSLAEACSGAAWGGQLSPASVSLLSGGSGTATLSVPIPGTAEGGSWCDYFLTVSVDSVQPPPPP